jgi:glycosyltransferase involved in cell wall biosynthesis
MNRTPAVSIGMPVYNGERFLEASARAILSQSFTDFELIVSDNGSSDGSVAVAQRLAREDSRIRVVANDRNYGAAYNYRRLFHESRGRYFKWAACNDFCAPDHVGRCVSVLEQRPEVILAYTRTKVFVDDLATGLPYEEGFDVLSDSPTQRFRTVLEKMRLNNLFNGVFRREALERVPLAGDYMSSDIVMLAELALLGKFVELPEYAYFRRLDKEAATSLMSGEHLRKHLLGKFSAQRLQMWRATGVLVTAPLRHWLSPVESVRLGTYVLRRTYWKLPELAAELREVFQRRPVSS